MFPKPDYIVATRGKDYAMVYIPTGYDAKLDLNLCGWPNAKAWWYNRQTGEAQGFGRNRHQPGKRIQTRNRRPRERLGTGTR